MELTTRLSALATIALLSGTAHSAVPHVFSAGGLAKASEVNDNFDNLDARIESILEIGRHGHLTEVNADCDADAGALKAALADLPIAGNAVIHFSGACEGPITLARDNTRLQGSDGSSIVAGDDAIPAEPFGPDDGFEMSQRYVVDARASNLSLGNTRIIAQDSKRALRVAYTSMLFLEGHVVLDASASTDDWHAVAVANNAMLGASYLDEELGIEGSLLVKGNAQSRVIDVRNNSHFSIWGGPLTIEAGSADGLFCWQSGTCSIRSNIVHLSTTAEAEYGLRFGGGKSNLSAETVDVHGFERALAIYNNGSLWSGDSNWNTDGDIEVSGNSTLQFRGNDDDDASRTIIAQRIQAHSGSELEIEGYASVSASDATDPDNARIQAGRGSLVTLRDIDSINAARVQAYHNASLELENIAELNAQRVHVGENSSAAIRDVIATITEQTGVSNSSQVEIRDSNTATDGEADGVSETQWSTAELYVGDASALEIRADALVVAGHISVHQASSLRFDQAQLQLNAALQLDAMPYSTLLAARANSALRIEDSVVQVLNAADTFTETFSGENGEQNIAINGRLQVEDNATLNIDNSTVELDFIDVHSGAVARVEGIVFPWTRASSHSLVNYNNYDQHLALTGHFEADVWQRSDIRFGGLFTLSTPQIKAYTSENSSIAVSLKEGSTGTLNLSCVDADNAGEYVVDAASTDRYERCEND